MLQKVSTILKGHLKIFTVKYYLNYARFVKTFLPNHFYTKTYA